MNKEITQKQIVAKRERILIGLKKLYDKEKALQELCTHANVNKKYCGSSGNYDPSADSYWIDFSCPDCGKRWTKDQ